jgi:hypothetical protein
VAAKNQPASIFSLFHQSKKREYSHQQEGRGFHTTLKRMVAHQGAHRAGEIAVTSNAKLKVGGDEKST